MGRTASHRALNKYIKEHGHPPQQNYHANTRRREIIVHPARVGRMSSWDPIPSPTGRKPSEPELQNIDPPRNVLPPARRRVTILAALLGLAAASGTPTPKLPIDSKN